jgi:hypothetical protein
MRKAAAYSMRIECSWTLCTPNFSSKVSIRNLALPLQNQLVDAVLKKNAIFFFRILQNPQIYAVGVV